MKGIRFEKVSFNQFQKDYDRLGGKLDKKGLLEVYDAIKLPQKKVGAVGYDFYSPFSTVLWREDHIEDCLPTGIRVVMPAGFCLLLIPRFSSGIRLVNSIGIVHSDSHARDDEGHIIIKVKCGGEPVHIKRGDSFMQGVIVKTFEAEGDEENHD